MYKLGSLFDGSGGFPLAGTLCGITPVWASEIEPFPIAVTKSRFPNMKHLGNISNINGAEIEPVDIITFGSPCQDLSVAGKRAGLKHEDNGDEETTRSGLFMEAIRIIKEMRKATNGEYPRFALWENVPGAFSSNKGEDFRIVLEEFVKIKEPSTTMPAADKNGWPYADCYMGDGWSIAYRVLDAQHWGVPQRRRRIYLVADFRGERAGEILFKRDGLRGYFTESGKEGQGAADDIERGFATTDRTECITLSNVASTLRAGTDAPKHEQDFCRAFGCRKMITDTCILDDQGGSQISVRTDGKVPTLRAESHGNIPCIVESGGFCPETGGNDPSRSVAFQNELTPTLRAGFTPAVVCKIFSERGNGNNAVTNTITGDHENKITDYTSVVVEGAKPTGYCLQSNGIDRADTAGCNGKGVNEDVSYTLNTLDRHAVAYAMQAIGEYKESEKSSSLKTRDYKDATDLVVSKQPIALDRAFYNQGVNAQYDPQLYEDGTCPTLVAKGPAAVCERYIVRRLTPTECARLQGFPDKWAHPDPKENFTDEEYHFWLDVRNTHAEINGKTVKQYTKAQMLTWYNKLHTDSAEYKLWGNGIALPTALYVMQGIEDELRKETTT